MSHTKTEIKAEEKHGKRGKDMNIKLYKLALWYIKKCNTKCKNRYKPKVELLTRLTYWAFDKYLLLYGCDAEWQIFDKYDVLDNAIQRLAEYENIGTVEEFKALKKEEFKALKKEEFKYEVKYEDKNFVLHYVLGDEIEPIIRKN